MQFQKILPYARPAAQTERTADVLRDDLTEELGLAGYQALGARHGKEALELLDEVVPDLILFADTGGEKPETYRYMPVIQAYLKKVKFPPVVTVRYEPKIAPYRTLDGQCLHTGTLPSLAYGGKSCSLKWIQ